MCVCVEERGRGLKGGKGGRERTHSIQERTHSIQRAERREKRARERGMAGIATMNAKR